MSKKWFTAITITVLAIVCIAITITVWPRPDHNPSGRAANGRISIAVDCVTVKKSSAKATVKLSPLTGIDMKVNSYQKNSNIVIDAQEKTPPKTSGGSNAMQVEIEFTLPTSFQGQKLVSLTGKTIHRC